MASFPVVEIPVTFGNVLDRTNELLVQLIAVQELRAEIAYQQLVSYGAEFRNTQQEAKTIANSEFGKYHERYPK